MRRLIELATLALVGYSFYIIRLTMPWLPARVATHFRWDGTPNGWSSPRTLWYLFAIQAGITALFFLLPAVAARFPSLVNVGRHTLADFGADARKRAGGVLAEMLARLALALNLLMVYLTREIIRIALRPGRKFPPGWVPIVFVAAALLIVIVYVRQFEALRPSEPAKTPSTTP
jgi:uncharacterized membrane protein